MEKVDGIRKIFKGRFNRVSSSLLWYLVDFLCGSEFFDERSLFKGKVFLCSFGTIFLPQDGKTLKKSCGVRIYWPRIVLLVV